MVSLGLVASRYSCLFSAILLITVARRDFAAHRFPSFSASTQPDRLGHPPSDGRSGRDMRLCHSPRRPPVPTYHHAPARMRVSPPCIRVVQRRAGTPDHRQSEVRDHPRVVTVKRYIKALAVRWDRSENAVREHLSGRLMVARERRPEGNAARRGLDLPAGREQRLQDNLRNDPLEQFLRTGDLEAYRAACKRSSDR